MARNAEDEDFLKLREALAPPAEPPEVLAPLVPDPTAELQPTPEIDTTPPPPGLPVQHGTPMPQPQDSYGAGADKAALEAAIADRGQADVGAKFLDAASLFNKAGGGHAGDLAAPERAHRDDSFNDVMRRRAMADQDSSAQKRQKDAALDAAMRDPRSDVSVRARALFAGTTVGKALRDRMGDQFDSLSASQLPGAKDIIGSETDLLKAGLKAHGGDDGSAAALETLVAEAENFQPGLGAQFRAAYAGAPKDVIKTGGFGKLHQMTGEKFTQGENEKNRTASYGKATEEHAVAEDTKHLGRLQDLGSAIKPEMAQAGVALKNLIGMVDSAEQKYGPNNIPGTGPFARLAAMHPFLADKLQSDEANQFQQQANLINVLGRHDITGAAFKPAEEVELRGLLANLSSGKAVKNTIGRLKQMYQAALDRTYAAHPDTWREFLSKVPELQTDNFKIDAPVAKGEAAPHLPALSPDAAKARGINPSGMAPPIDTSTPVQDTPSTATKVSQGLPPQKPGKVTMELEDGRFIYVLPGKVEEARARLKASPVKYGP